MPNNNDITLTVGMETSDVTQAADTLGKKLEAIFNRASGKKLSASTKSILQQMDVLSTRMDKIRQSMTDMEGKTFDNSRFTEIDKALQEAQQRVTDLQNAMLALEQMGQKTANGIIFPTKDLERQYFAFAQQLKEADAEAQNLYDELMRTPTTLVGEETQEYQDLANQLNTVINRLTVYRARLSETKDGANLDISGWQRLANVLGKIITFLPKLAFNTVTRGLKAVSSAALSAAKNLAKIAATKIGRGISKLGSSIFGLKKDISSADESFKRGLKTFVKYAFGVRSLFFLIRRLRTFLLQGLQGLGDAYAPFGQTIQSFKNSLNELKGSFISAFAPIASTVIPILNTLMSAIAKVLDMIGMLFAALRGQTSYVKASVVPATTSAGKAASGAAKETEKYKKTLAGFDDVQILNAPTSPSGSGGGGGGGGGGDTSWAATEMPIDSVIAGLAQNIRELIANQDWEGLGTFLAEKVNGIFTKAKNLLESSELQAKISLIINAITTTLNTFVNKIDWNLIGETFGAGINLIIGAANRLLTGINWTAIGSSIATGLNGLIQKVDWTGIGNFFSNKLNVIIDTVNGFVSNFDWRGAASKFTQGLNAFITNIHWSDAAHAISEGIKGALNFLTTAISEFNWYGLGNKIATFIGEIDWSGIFSALSEAIGAATAGLESFLIGLIQAAWQGVVDWWHDVAFEDGQFTISGLLDGIVDALKNIGKWIKDNIFKPFTDGFRNAFRIGSPSKVMEDFGGDIIDGLLKGLKDTWEDIKGFFKGAVDGLSEFFKDPVGSVKVAIDKGVDKAKDVWNGFKNSTVVKTLKETGGNVIEKVKTTWDGIKDSSAVKTLKEAGSAAIDKVKTTWDSFKNSTVVKTLKEAGSSAIQTVKTNIWDKFTSNTITKTLKSALDKTFNTAKSAYDSMYNKTVEVTAKGKIVPTSNEIRGLTLYAKKVKAQTSSGQWVDVTAAKGGAYYGGKWHDIPQYAGGTLNAGGSMFIAGEAGPEVVGHIGGRTEVLNQSQLAATMYASVYSAIANVASASLRYISSMLVLVGNGIINAISSFETNLPNLLPETISVPEIATGFVVPSMAQITAMQRNNELLANAIDSLNQDTSSRLTNDELEAIIERVIKRYMNIQFYIGDEQIARHANAGNDKLALRYNPAMR